MEHNKNENQKNNQDNQKRSKAEEVMEFFLAKGAKLGTKTGAIMMPYSGKPAIKKKSGKGNRTS